MVKSADESGSRAETQAEADECPHHRNDAGHGKAMHHGAEDILFSNQAAVEQGQTGDGHHQDKGGTDKHPAVVGGKLGILHGQVKLLEMLLDLAVGRRGCLGMEARAEAACDKEKQEHDARKTGSTRRSYSGADRNSARSQATLISAIPGCVPGTEAPLLDPSHND
jgi:hypothetical protein